MAEYILTGPDGVKYKVTAPEGTSNEDLIAFVAKNAPPPMEMESTTNVPRMIGESTVKGLTNLAGAPGSVSDVVMGTFDKVLGPAFNRTAGAAIDTVKGLARGDRDALKEAASAPLPVRLLRNLYDPSAEARRLAEKSTPRPAVNAFSTGGMQDRLRTAGAIGSPDAIPQTAGERYLSAAVEGAASSPFGIGAAIAGAAGGAGAELGKNSVPQEYQQLGQIVGGILGGTGGALGSAALETGLRRAITPLPSRLTQEEARLAQIARQEGIRLTPGQATGNEGMQTVERSLAQLPLSSAAQRAVYDQQRVGFNRAVLQRAGINAERATPEVLDDAFNRLGQTFDALAARTTVRVDPGLQQAVNRAVQNYGRRLDTNIAPKFNSYVDDINQAIAAAAQPGVTRVTIDGRTFQNIHSDLARDMRAAASNPDLQRALGALSQALDDAMTRSMSPAMRDAWREARRDYRNLLMVDRSMAMAPAADRLTGNIPPGAFTQAVRQADPRGFGRGRGELNDLARVGQFLADRIPDSGTARRSYTMGLLTGGAPAATGGSAALMGAGPGGALATAAATLAAPPIAQRILNSPAMQAYLTNQLIPQGAQGIGASQGAVLGALPAAERMAALLRAQQALTAGQQ